MKKKILLCFALLSYSLLLSAQDSSSAVFSTKSGAIKGYDPVAYFTDGKAVKGDSNIRFDWNGASWHFASVAHRDLFASNPEQYAPQYGGYCAYGWSKGYAVKIDPEAWRIVDGKLYLNYDQSVQKEWDKDRQTFIQRADQNWAKARH